MPGVSSMITSTAGRFLEAADVATLAPDDAAFHVVGRDRHRAHGVIGGLLGGVALDGLQDDLSALVLGFLLRLLSVMF